jgi:hypothetical protein
MNLFSLAFLIEGDRTQNRRQNHPWAVNPGQSLVHADGAASFATGNFGRANRVIGADEIQVARDRSEGEMRPAVWRTGVLPPAPTPKITEATSGAVSINPMS